MVIAEEKVELRKYFKRLRSQLTAEQAASGSLLTAHQILACDAYRKANCIMGYLAFGNELSVDLVLQQALADAMRMLNENAPNDQVIKLKSLEALQKMADGKATKIIIPSEIQGLAGLQPQQLDLVLVPGVAFGRDGSRLGMGAGYYDRFLPQAENALLMGIAYDAFIQPNLPRDEFDVLVQLLASESGITTLSPLSL